MTFNVVFHFESTNLLEVANLAPSTQFNSIIVSCCRVMSRCYLMVACCLLPAAGKAWAASSSGTRHKGGKEAHWAALHDQPPRHCGDASSADRHAHLNLHFIFIFIFFFFISSFVPFIFSTSAESSRLHPLTALSVGGGGTLLRLSAAHKQHGAASSPPS